MLARLRISVISALALCVPACGDDDQGVGYGSGTVADQVGVGAQCTGNADCPQPQDMSFTQKCLPQFEGGYCGLEDCAANVDCPPGSACVLHEGTTYCFRQCRDKSECNLNRAPDVESNCSSNVEFTEAGTPGKACVPPSSGL